MKEFPDYIRPDKDCILIRISVCVPWLDKELCYEHILDEPGLREEFGPLEEITDYTDFRRRQELLETRTRTVEHFSQRMARSILNALGRTK